MRLCIICGDPSGGQTTCGPKHRKQLERVRNSMIEKKCPLCARYFFGRTCKECTTRKTTNSFDRDFVAWDGEGEDNRYTLLANSYGDAIHKREGLGTIECLEFLLTYSRVNTTNVWYGFGYDVGMMLRDLPMHRSRRSLKELWERGHTRWHGYTVTYIPRKSFSVSHHRTGRRFHSYDSIGFFQTKFETAVTEWCDAVPAIITEGKASRETFATWPMSRIIEYNAEECRLLVIVMSRFREALRHAELFVRRWDGAGAIAATWLRKHSADAYYGKVPQAMVDPLSRTFFGGRSDILGVGKTECIYSDINSAYPAAMCEVPDMTQLVWRYDAKPSRTIDPYGVYHVSWNVPIATTWGPLPWRWSAGSISYPLCGEGWYIGVEVASAIRRFGNRIRVLGAFKPDGTIHHPLAALIRKDYEHRAKLKRDKHPANIPIKLGLNSLYGKRCNVTGTVAKHLGGKISIGGRLSPRTHAPKSTTRLIPVTLSRVRPTEFFPRSHYRQA